MKYKCGESPEISISDEGEVAVDSGVVGSCHRVTIFGGVNICILAIVIGQIGIVLKSLQDVWRAHDA